MLSNKLLSIQRIRFMKYRIIFLMIFFATSVNANTTFFEDEDEFFLVSSQDGLGYFQLGQNYVVQDYPFEGVVEGVVEKVSFKTNLIIILLVLVVFLWGWFKKRGNRKL